MHPSSSITLPDGQKPENQKDLINSETNFAARGGRRRKTLQNKDEKHITVVDTSNGAQ